MQHTVLRTIADYSRFVLQEERKMKLFRPLLPKVPFMNMGNNSYPIEDNKDPAFNPAPNKQLNTFSFWRGMTPLPAALEDPKEETLPPIQMIQTAEYAGNVESEDRISIGSLQSLGAQVMSVFDGHGGSMLSDYCANNIVELLDTFLSKNKHKPEYFQNEDLLIGTALKSAYNMLENNFYEHVYKEQVNLKNKKIKSIGTCGITVVIYNSKVYVANCGDSMAMIVTEDEGRVDFVSLHERLSVNNPKERQRLLEEFPEDSDILVEAGKGCYYLKGRLQPTRTVGDYYMKHKEQWKGKNKKQFNGPYVKSEPDIHIKKIQQSFKHLIIASDGVWDFLSEWEVVKACQGEEQSQSLLNQTLSKIADLNGKTVRQIKELNTQYRRDFHDDISIIIAPLNYYH